MISILIKSKRIFLNIMLFCGFLSTTTKVFGMIELAPPYFQNDQQKRQPVRFFIQQQSLENNIILRQVNSEGVLENFSFEMANIDYQKLTVQETTINNTFSFSILKNNTLSEEIIKPTKDQFDTVSSCLSNNKSVYVYIINRIFILESQNTNTNILNKLSTNTVDHEQLFKSLRGYNSNSTNNEANQVFNNNENTADNSDNITIINANNQQPFTDSGIYYTPESSSETDAQAGNNNDFFDNTELKDAPQMTEDHIIQTIIDTYSAPFEKADRSFVVTVYRQFERDTKFYCTFYSMLSQNKKIDELPESDVPNIDSLPIIYTDQFNSQSQNFLDEYIKQNCKFIISFQQEETTRYYHVKIKEDPNANTNTPSETTETNGNVNPKPTDYGPIYISGRSALIITAFLIVLAYKYNYVPDALSYYIINIKNYVSSMITNRLSLSLFNT